MAESAATKASWVASFMDVLVPFRTFITVRETHLYPGHPDHDIEILLTLKNGRNLRFGMVGPDRIYLKSHEESLLLRLDQVAPLVKGFAQTPSSHP